MLIDAIVLAGGRSSRLGSAKADLIYQRQTLLERSVDAVRQARMIVVVGDVGGAHSLPDRVLVTREEPPYGGPAAGVAAGAARLASADPQSSDYTTVLACDMPRAAALVEHLLKALPSHPQTDGVIAADGERRQPLAAVYRTAALSAAITAADWPAEGKGPSMFQFIAGLDLALVIVDPGSSDDVDTWQDAAEFGIRMPARAPSAEPSTREKR